MKHLTRVRSFAAVLSLLLLVLVPATLAAGNAVPLRQGEGDDGNAGQEGSQLVSIVGDVDVRVVMSADDAEEEIATGEVWTKGWDLELGTDSRAGAPVPLAIGIRFANLAIPQGATITQAYLEFTASEAQGDATSVNVKVEARDDAPSYTGDTGAVTSRATLPGGVAWNGIPPWAEGMTYQTPDLKAVVQQIVNRPGWVPGNAMAFQITGTGRRTAWSWDGADKEGNLTWAPRLYVGFSGQVTCHSLTTNVLPAGTGSVSAAPPPNCEGKYIAGTAVTLTATPIAEDYAFTNWSGNASGTTNPVTITMDGVKTVTANFERRTCYRLIAQVLPDVDPYAGEVRRDPDYNCGGDKYQAGTSVELYPIARGGWDFDGWSGPNAGDLVDNGDDTYQLLMNGNKTLIATFTAACRTINVDIMPPGSGTVEKTPPPNCTFSKWLPGTTVSLRAVPAAGHIFVEWAGDVTGSANPIEVIMDGNKSVDAKFVVGSHRLFLPITRRGVRR